jgi:hypothetical protein
MVLHRLCQGRFRAGGLPRRCSNTGTQLISDDAITFIAILLPGVLLVYGMLLAATGGAFAVL